MVFGTESGGVRVRRIHYLLAKEKPLSSPSVPGLSAVFVRYNIQRSKSISSSALKMSGV